MLGKRGHDVRRFVTPEHWVIATLAEFNVTGEIPMARRVWVQRHDKPLTHSSLWKTTGARHPLAQMGQLSRAVDQR
jgi:hypothetical protein